MKDIVPVLIAAPLLWAFLRWASPDMVFWCAWSFGLLAHWYWLKSRAEESGESGESGPVS